MYCGKLKASKRSRQQNIMELKATTTGRATKTALKKWIHAASNFIVLIPFRLIRQMLENVFGGVRILKDCMKVQEKKKKVVVLCSSPQQNMKLGTFTS